MDRATILELVGWVAFSRHSERERERGKMQKSWCLLGRNAERRRG